LVGCAGLDNVGLTSEIEEKQMRAIRVAATAAVLTAGLLAPAPAHAEELPITWLSCAHGTVADAFASTAVANTAPTMFLSAQATPCTASTPPGQFGIALYKRERLTGQPAPAELVGLSRVGSGGQLRASGGYSTALFGSAGVCVVAGLDVRLDCYWIDDPQPGVSAPVISDIAVDDPAVARPIEDIRVVLIGRHPSPLCGTCW
jgi:hypothetical protein